MSHNDPALWASYLRIHKETDALRQQSSTLRDRVPQPLQQLADRLTYHLLEARTIAKVLAGDRPAELDPGLQAAAAVKLEVPRA
jgi:hypothetical protein